MRTSKRRVSGTLFGCCLLAASLLAQQDGVAPAPTDDPEKHHLLDWTIENQKKSDAALDLYERIERVESRKTARDPQPAEVRVFRVVPAGTGVDRILLGPEAKPVNGAAYRAELQKLTKALEWASQQGRPQREAYEKIAKKRKERTELIEATHTAFLYTWLADEPRGDRILSKFRMEPNPAYKPTSRVTSIFAKVRGYVWIDKPTGQLARVDAEITDDISIGGFLAKVYKGSHFMQERYEVEPGLWLPSFSQYDFDGRKFFLGFSVHERTFYGNYRRIGPPKEALPIIRAELDKMTSVGADP